MRKAFLISLGAHIFLFIIMYIATLFSTPMKPPKTVYSVKIIAAPQEPTTQIVKNDNKQNTHKEKPKPRVISKPKRRTRHKPKPKSRPKPKPTAKSNPTKTLRQGKASLQVEGKNFTDDFYLNLIITKIANNWLNPLRGGRKISTVIYFKIQKNGDVTDIKIEKSFQTFSNQIYIWGIILLAVVIIIGFFMGQFLHMPSFDKYNLLDAMRRPRSHHIRR